MKLDMWKFPVLLMKTRQVQSFYQRINRFDTKHIDLRYHDFIQEKVKAGDFRVDHVNTLKNLADLLSKNVTHATHLMNGPWIESFEIREGDKVYGIHESRIDIFLTRIQDMQCLCHNELRCLLSLK